MRAGLARSMTLGTRRRGGTEEGFWGVGGTLDDVFGCAEVFAEEFGLVFEERVFEVGGKKAVLNVNPGG